MQTREATRPRDDGRPGARAALALAQLERGSTLTRALVVFVVLAAASFLTRLPFLRADFVNVDEAAHLVGSWEILRGGQLYVDFADNKPPLVYLFYAVAQSLFGRGLFAVRLLATFTLLPLTALAAAAFFDYGRAGICAALAFVVASATLLASDAHAVHCEHVMLLPLAWSLVVLRSPRSLGRGDLLFAAGALVGIAALGKQPAAACLGVYAVAVVLARFRSWRWGCAHHPEDGLVLTRAGARALRRWAAFRVVGRSVGLVLALSAGFFLPLLLAALWFALRGSFGQAVFWIVRFNLGHIDNPMPAPDKAVRIVEMGSLLLPAVLPLLACAWRGRAHLPGAHRRLLPLLFALATFLPAWLGLRLFGHYFLPFVFALALVAGPFLRAERRDPTRRAILGAGVAAVLGFTIVSHFVYQPGRGVVDVTRPEYQRIARVLRSDTCSRNGSLFVWGYAPTVYAYAGEPPASRFVVPVETLTGYLTGNDAFEQGRVDTRGRINEAHWDWLMADLESNKPAHVVDMAPADLNRWGPFSLDRFPRLDVFLRQHYRVHAVIDGAVIYRRNDCSASFIEARR